MIQVLKMVAGGRRHPLTVGAVRRFLAAADHAGAEESTVVDTRRYLGGHGRSLAVKIPAPGMVAINGVSWRDELETT